MSTSARTIAADLNGFILPTPVMIAAGCAGVGGQQLADVVELEKVGAIVSRTVTFDPDPGSPSPRVAESASGVIWSTGWQNPGADVFVAEELPGLAAGGTLVVVSVGGGTLEDFVRVTGALQGQGAISAIEVDLTGPDREVGRPVLGDRRDRAVEIAGAVARMSLVPVFAKLPVFATDLPALAREVVTTGVHGLTIGGSLPAFGVRADQLEPVLGSGSGWLSGPAIKPVTLRAVHDVAAELPDVPLVAVGGLRSGEDAVEAMLAGAWAVQTGTATLIDPGTPVAMATGIARYLRDRDLLSPRELRTLLAADATATGSISGLADPHGIDPAPEDAEA
jgi:dihydroorotate dehydrogenase (NAD+) catalytic subunit